MLLLDIETVVAEQDKDVGAVAVAVAGAEMDFTGSMGHGSFWRGKDNLRLFRNSRCRPHFSVLSLPSTDFGRVTCQSPMHQNV